MKEGAIILAITLGISMVFGTLIANVIVDRFQTDMVKDLQARVEKLEQRK
jgi:hypothetical protein